MELNRRTLLQATGGALAVGAAGCSDTQQIPSDAPTELPRPTIGSENATQTLQVFEDMGCPACRHFNIAILPELTTEFIDTEQLRIEHYDFVLPADANSMDAAIGGRAVQDTVGMDAFLQYKSEIFQQQPQLSVQRILDIAEETGADRDTVESRIENNYYGRVVENDREFGESLGVNSTPSFAVDGERQLDLDIENYQTFRNDLAAQLF